MRPIYSIIITHNGTLCHTIYYEHTETHTKNIPYTYSYHILEARIREFYEDTEVHYAKIHYRLVYQMDCIIVYTQCNVCERPCRLHILRYDLLSDRSLIMGMGLSHMERSCINHVEHSRILISDAKLLRNTRIGVSVYERCPKECLILSVRS